MHDDKTEIFSIADEAGWTEETLLRLCIDYIQENCGLDDLLEELRAKADEEFSYDDDDDDTTSRYRW